MSRLVAFYAPLKPPDHPVPSGDRRMARLLVQALQHAGCRVELASRLRSYDNAGDRERQDRLARLGGRVAERVLRRYRSRPAQARPSAWLTYHAYHKSPDWLGPPVTGALGIPYLIAEASFAPRQAGGRWALGHAATEQAIRAADVVLALTEVDAACLRPLIRPPAALVRLPPFLDAGPFLVAAERRAEYRAELAARFDLDPSVPWLLAVGMMRDDVKLVSYRLLAEALARLLDRDWRLIVVGDGSARAAVAGALGRLGEARVVFAGARETADLPAFYAAADLFVWPAVREAYGLAMLEAQAAGLPVVAGREGGVSEVVLDGLTGNLVAARDPSGFAAAVRDLIDRSDERARMAEHAQGFVRRQRGLERAAQILQGALQMAEPIRARRPAPG